jgi:hypothetical protein
MVLVLPVPGGPYSSRCGSRFPFVSFLTEQQQQQQGQKHKQNARRATQLLPHESDTQGYQQCDSLCLRYQPLQLPALGAHSLHRTQALGVLGVHAATWLGMHKNAPHFVVALQMMYMVALRSDI